MPKQKSLFSDDTEPAAASVLVVPGGAGHLTREQKQFNKLVAQIAATKNELARWHAVIEQLRQRQTREVLPLLAEMRGKRKLLAALYDGAMDGKALGKRERAKLADIIVKLVGPMIEEEEEPELVRLYDKYSDISHEEEQDLQSDLMAQMAQEMFGVKLDGTEAAGTPEDVMQRIAEKMEAEEAERAARAAKSRRKNTKATQREEARQAAREEEERNATKSVREVYRKLASELHPDREPDAAERERKTRLMQRVNKAYDDGDLLALLELQLEIEQINPDNLTNMARDRLLRFNAVLSEQLSSLRDEVDEVIAPFTMGGNIRSTGDLTPAQLSRAVDVEIADIRHGLHLLARDLIGHQDPAKLKQALKSYRISKGDDEFDQAMAELDFMMEMAPTRPRRGRR